VSFEMNRKREEELMQLAFGDLRREENGQLQAEISTDPEAAKAFSSYRDMCDGLKALRDVPEMQLSTERLRDAILSGGLQPRPVSRWNFNWLATPIAVGACAFVIVLAVRKPHTIPMPSGTVAMDTPSVDGSNPKKDWLGVTDFGANDDVSPKTAPQAATISHDVTEQTPRMRHHVLRKNNGSMMVAALTTTPNPGLAKALSMPTFGNINANTSMTFAAKTADATRGAQAEQNSPKGNEIVMIDAQPDAETGAARATEVKSSSNVVIGG
jgi:hypothetical protein